MSVKPAEFFYSHGQRMEVPRGTVLHDYAQPWEGCFFLDSGACALSALTRTGEDRTLLYFQSKRLIGFMHIMRVGRPTQPPIPVLITAKTPCTLYRLSAAVLDDLLERDPDFPRYMTQVLAENYDQLLHRYHSALDEGATARLCRTLLEFAEDDGGDLVMPPYFNYVELSRYLGLHTVTVSRIIAHLKEKDYIRKKGRQIMLAQPEGLSRLISQGVNLNY